MSKDEGTAQTEQETANTMNPEDGKPPAAPASPTGRNPTAANNPTASIPRCVCSWKNCRVYQKFFRDHPVWDGVVKLKFTDTEPEAMALKKSIDTNLKVSKEKAEDWKAGKGESKVIKYNVACHHWTEAHIRKYRGDTKHYSFIKPFSIHGAQKYLFKVDTRETFKDPNGNHNDDDDDDDELFLQSPLVPKEEVKNLFYRIKEENEKPKKREETAPVAKAAGAEGDNSGRKGRGLEERKDSLTVSTNRSNKTSEVLLQEKEVENKRLKDQLEAMQSQLSFLHDMVQKLQEEHYDQQSARGGRAAGGPKPGSGGRRRANNNDGSSRRTGSRSSRSSVPNEIEIESEDDGNWIEPAIDEEWSEEDDDDDESDDGERSTGTFHVNYNDGGRMQRRNSFSSRASRTSRATSIVSASKSVKSLPREIEMDDDEDESHESLEEEAFDNKSFASSKKRPSRNRGGGSSHNRKGGSHGLNGKLPRRRQSISNNSRGASSGVSRGGRSKGSDDAGSVSGVYQVTALTVTDPYGEQGTYTGSISNSTGMPHGFGRLEYDKAGRWYEGDWRHGRWTGQGRLSNGDGDFYEGGLKSDHKHGRGVMKFADGRIFEGEYINGQMVEGKMTYQDGSTYTGGWVDGMRHGRGRCVFTDQSVYEGEFREGEFFGFGKMSWSDGGWYEGEWYNGEMQVRAKFYG